MKYECKIIRSNRKTLSLEIARDLQIIVRAPMRYPQRAVNKFIQKHEAWIEKSLIKCQKRMEIEKANLLTEEQINDLKEKARDILPEKVLYYSKMMGLRPTDVKITSAQRRFGSCNGKNSLCFSYKLMLYPEAAIDYVVVHELAHIKHKNHGKAFYELIAKYMPDYKQRDSLLKQKV